MFNHLIKLGLNPICCQKEITCINEIIIRSVHGENFQKDEHRDELMLQKWFALLVALGSDIQSVHVDEYLGAVDRHESFLRVFCPLQAEQRRIWSKFDVVRKGGGSLEAIQEAVVSGELDLASYDSIGLKLVHVAAAYDRVDLLEWLVEANPLQLDEVDGSGRSVLNVAIASNASGASLWISRRKAAQRISSFVVSSIRHRRAVEEVKTRLHVVTAMQAWCRAYHVRRVHRGRLPSRLQETHRFQTTWGHVLAMVEKDGVLDSETSWGAIKTNRFDLLGSMEENGEREFSPEDHSESSKKLESATSLAASARHDEALPEATDDTHEIDPSNGVEPTATGVDTLLGTGFDRIF
jgi:hypothetical protein